MADLDKETLSDVLRVARDHGYRHVRIKSGRQSFEADLGERDEEADLQEAHGSETEVTAPQSADHVLTAPVVGYYRQPVPPLEVGARIAVGQNVGEVLALGIANEIVAKVAGEITEVLVEDGAALEYGQALAKVMES